MTLESLPSPIHNEVVVPKILILLASLNGFIALSLGAFAAHGLKTRLSTEMLNTFQTGVQYQMVHALALLGVGVLALGFPNAVLPKSSEYFFILGLILFSGSLYVLSVTGIRWLGAITPIGGLGLLAGNCTGRTAPHRSAKKLPNCI